MSDGAGLKVRAAEIGDVEALADLMTDLGYKTRASEMAARMNAIKTDSRYRTFVAVQDAKIVGMIGTLACATYEHNDLGGRILALVVSSDVRSSGIGRMLMAAAERDFADRKITRVALDTRFERERAHKFYEDLGYAKNGFRLVKKLTESA
jgi:ribosomal protein S18 acetylase RimI-like enzyme